MNKPAIQAYLTLDELDYITKVASRLHLSKSAFARTAMFEKARRESYRIKLENQAEVSNEPAQ